MEENHEQPTKSHNHKSNSNNLYKIIIVVLAVLLIASMLRGGKKASGGTTSNFGKNIERISACSVLDSAKAGSVLGGDIDNSLSSFSDSVNTNGADSTCDYAVKVNDNESKRLSVNVRKTTDVETTKKLLEEDKNTYKARGGDGFKEIDGGFFDKTSGQGQVMKGDYWIIVRTSGLGDDVEKKVVEVIDAVKGKL